MQKLKSSHCVDRGALFIRHCLPLRRELLPSPELQDGSAAHEAKLTQNLQSCKKLCSKTSSTGVGKKKHVYLVNPSRYILPTNTNRSDHRNKDFAIKPHSLCSSDSCSLARVILTHNLCKANENLLLSPAPFRELPISVNLLSITMPYKRVLLEPSSSATSKSPSLSSHGNTPLQTPVMTQRDSVHVCPPPSSPSPSQPPPTPSPIERPSPAQLAFVFLKLREEVIN